MFKGLGVYFAPFVLGAFFIGGCGGGGGGGSSAGGGNVTPTGPTPVTSTTPSMAMASGRLVDDSTGAAMGGVNIGLAPWTTGATPTPEGTTAPDGSFTFTAQPGHYLLVIGSDSPSDTTRATIHDNVTLVGGANTLQAPVLPPWPTVTPPPWETNGAYRLGTIDANVMIPCLNAYDAHRVGAGLTAVVEDDGCKKTCAMSLLGTVPGFITLQAKPRRVAH